jgi:hypothetical protein
VIRPGGLCVPRCGGSVTCISATMSGDLVAGVAEAVDRVIAGVRMS